MRALEVPNVHFDPAAFLQVAGQFAEEPGTCLLFSGKELPQSSRSFLFLFPYDFLHLYGGKQHRFGIDQTQIETFHFCNPWDALKSHVTSRDGIHPYPEWVGYLNYEMGAFCDLDKQLSYQASDAPDGCFQRCALVIVLDHVSCKISLIIADDAIALLNKNQKEWVSRLTDFNYWLDLARKLSKQTKIDDLFCEDKLQLTLNTPIETLEEYSAKINLAKELINEGEIYQVNLSQQFVFSGVCTPFSLFLQLAQLNPAPFSAYFKKEDYAIVSSSPERFLSCQQGILETRPIKGTALRGRSEEEDYRNKQILLTSEKERAELLMITDLMRNDLGKLSVPGSVITEELWKCESYTNVFHLVSTIRSKSLEMHSVDKVRACFPGGSISGCPKLSAMEVIQHIEKRRRGIYTGSIGYFSPNGDFDFNIAIRTLFIEKDKATLQVGGGIVSDSDPEKEYLETLHKGASIFRVLGVNLYRT